MMLSDAKIYAGFGAGSVAVGCFKVDDPELYCVSIGELAKAAPIGSIVLKVDVVHNTEVVLSFPTEDQMIAVMAAFTNKSFEVVHNAWKAKQAEKEEWKAAQAEKEAQ